METSVRTVTRYGKKGESGAMVATFSTTQSVQGADSQVVSKTDDFSVILLPSGNLVPERFATEEDATADLDRREAKAAQGVNRSAFLGGSNS